LTCDAKITENDVAVCIDKDVLRLNVPMNDVMCVNMLDGKELSNRFRGRSARKRERRTSSAM
jgi:hypothetical protein